ncbi:MAG: YdeI/OmpD-associated family protein [Lachnospiraceae bacterium]|nr:YdeI/OmpD-associated family protein [Lachnospiraceae bacterium]
MEIFRTDSRGKWRAWLEAHFREGGEVWFVFPMKEAKEDGVSYNDAVEEALCFGWIDSTNRKLDDLHCVRRFTPRKKGSSYSQANVERLIWLDRHGLIHPEVRESVLPVIQKPFVFPEDILKALRSDPEVWENYSGFSESYRRIRIAYIEAARKRPEEFDKRLKTFVEKTKKTS